MSWQERLQTSTIITAASHVPANNTETLTPGNQNLHRNVHRALDFDESMSMLLRLEQSAGHNITSCRPVMSYYLVERSCQDFGLDWNSHVPAHSSLPRLTDISGAQRGPSWTARQDVVKAIRLIAKQAAENV